MIARDATACIVMSRTVAFCTFSFSRRLIMKHNCEVSEVRYGDSRLPDLTASKNAPSVIAQWRLVGSCTSHTYLSGSLNGLYVSRASHVSSFFLHKVSWVLRIYKPDSGSLYLMNR
jgi:hypothetical protein